MKDGRAWIAGEPGDSNDPPAPWELVQLSYNYGTGAVSIGGRFELPGPVHALTDEGNWVVVTTGSGQLGQDSLSSVAVPGVSHSKALI